MKFFEWLFGKKFEKIVEFSPAYDKRSDNPKKDYGIGSVKIKFVLKGKKGAVQFLMGTDWYLLETIKEYREKGNRNLPPPINLKKDSPDGWDIGYHSPKQMYEGQKPMSSKCEYLPGGFCYYDGSGMRATPVVDILIRKGSEKVWEYLEEEYRSTFEEK